MPKTVTIIDYGLGNLFSISRAISYIGAEPLVSGDPETVAGARLLILPGVGAFGEGIANLRERGLDEAIRRAALENKAPFLGICLGMQLLMTVSEELGLHKGLGLIQGRVVRFPDPPPEGPGYKIPHIGWNELRMPEGLKGWDGTVLHGTREGDSMYFVHSYVPMPENPAYTLAETTYGRLTFCSVVRNNNIYGFQFHPEKSGKSGLNLLRNFVTLGG